MLLVLLMGGIGRDAVAETTLETPVSEEVSAGISSNPFDAVVNMLNADSSTATKVALTQALDLGKVNDQSFYDLPTLKAFYQENQFTPVWLSKSFGSQKKVNAIVDTLEEAWEHGLNPSNYNLAPIKALVESNDSDQNYQLELLLSDAVIRYGRDMTGMRVDPKAIGQRSKYWRQTMLGMDILKQVSSAADPKFALEGLAPKGQLYKALQEKLIILYKTKGPNPDRHSISIPRLLRPGDANKAILPIRERMGLAPNQASHGAYFYDDQLAQAVMAFQKGQGVTPDGIIGPQTVKLMNITTQDRINQIIVNLERLRWMEPNKPSRYVLVNVPSAILWAIEDGDVALEMPVVVGRKKRQTNIFSTTITGIRFNPRWTVPPTIKREDYLPKLREDPYYLTDRGIELVDKDNMSVDPGLINWEEKTWAEVNMMRMVQGSGRSNPLGLVRVIMENPFNIYLHDTPTKSYFKRSNRSLSSGCVRMAEPQKFADFVLSSNEGWSEERRKRLIARGREANIRAEQPLPVYIVYQTVWLGESGQIVYGQDIYDRDAKLLKELKKINGVKIPVKEVVQHAPEHEQQT